MGKKGRVQEQVPPKRRSLLSRFLIIVLPFWLSAKLYAGPQQDFIRIYFSAILLVILTGLLVQMVLPAAREKTILVTLFCFFSVIELIHKFAPAVIEGVTWTIGNYTMIGQLYTVNLIPYYGVGGFIGYFVLKACRDK